MSKLLLPKDRFEARLVRDRTVPLYYRQVILVAAISKRSHEFFVSPANQKRVLGAPTIRTIYDNMHKMVRAGLFEFDRPTGRYRRVYRDNETNREFVLRAAQQLDTKTALRWKLILMTRKSGNAPHSVQEFADELGKKPRKVERCLEGIVVDPDDAKKGDIVWYGGNGHRQPGSFARVILDLPEDDALHQDLLGRYGYHEPKHAKQQEEEVRDELIPEMVNVRTVPNRTQSKGTYIMRSGKMMLVRK